MRTWLLKVNLFLLWTILQLGICCNIPYFLARYLAEHAVSSHPGSPICGGHFVSSLAHLYGVIVPGITMTLTCKEGNEFSLGYLETMRVMVNMGSHWSIPQSDDEGIKQP